MLRDLILTNNQGLRNSASMAACCQEIFLSPRKFLRAKKIPTDINVTEMNKTLLHLSSNIIYNNSMIACVLFTKRLIDLHIKYCTFQAYCCTVPQVNIQCRRKFFMYECVLPRRKIFYIGLCKNIFLFLLSYIWDVGL